MRTIYELKKGGEFKSVLHSFNGLYISELNAFFINISSDSSKLWFYIHLEVGDWYRYTRFNNFSIWDIRKRVGRTKD